MLILTSRNHYTVDVVVASYVVPLLWHAHETTMPPDRWSLCNRCNLCNRRPRNDDAAGRLGQVAPAQDPNRSVGPSVGVAKALHQLHRAHHQRPKPER